MRPARVSNTRTRDTERHGGAHRRPLRRRLVEARLGAGALGRIEVADVAGHPQALAVLQAKYAPYRDRVPPGPLLLLRPQRVLWWRAG